MRLGTREQGARNPIPFFHISTKLCACRHDVLNPYLATAVFLVTAVFISPTDYWLLGAAGVKSGLISSEIDSLAALGIARTCTRRTVLRYAGFGPLTRTTQSTGCISVRA